MVRTTSVIAYSAAAGKRLQMAPPALVLPRRDDDLREMKALS
jgi:hypothetical protein